MWLAASWRLSPKRPREQSLPPEGHQGPLPRLGPASADRRGPGISWGQRTLCCWNRRMEWDWVFSFVVVVVFGLIFSVAVLQDEKMTVFIIECGNRLMLRSQAHGEDPGVGSAWLSWPGASQTRGEERLPSRMGCTRREGPEGARLPGGGQQSPTLSPPISPRPRCSQDHLAGEGRTTSAFPPRPGPGDGSDFPKATWDVCSGAWPDHGQRAGSEAAGPDRQPGFHLLPVGTRPLLSKGWGCAPSSSEEGGHL